MRFLDLWAVTPRTRGRCAHLACRYTTSHERSGRVFWRAPGSVARRLWRRAESVPECSGGGMQVESVDDALVTALLC
jgi:hypothetical protein